MIRSSNIHSRRAVKRSGLLPILCLAFVSPLALAQGPSSSAQDGNIARGVLRAEREAVLSSSVSERITGMPYREGDHFKKGAALVSFDCGRLSAELRAARASESAEERNALVQSELLAMEATGRADAEIAGLREKEREAQAQVIQQRMAGCKLAAPFSGRVVETLVRVHETPPPNERLIRVVSDGPLELHMVVPSKWLSWLRTGSSFGFKVDETGDVLQAKVQRISAGVDAVSQTVKVIGTVAKAPAQVRPGMSGRATLEHSSAEAKTGIVPTVAVAAPAPTSKTTPTKGAASVL